MAPLPSELSSLVADYVDLECTKDDLLAVTRNGRVLKYVREQTDEICLAAVKEDGLALKDVKEQTR